jgi:hypothetical protein
VLLESIKCKGRRLDRVSESRDVANLAQDCFDYVGGRLASSGDLKEESNDSGTRVCIFTALAVQPLGLYSGCLTCSLEDKVDLGREIGAIEMVFARCVEVKLLQIVALISNSGTSISENFDCSAQIEKLGALRLVVGAETERLAAEGGLGALEANRGLILSNGTKRVVAVQAVPIQRTV